MGGLEGVRLWGGGLLSNVSRSEYKDAQEETDLGGEVDVEGCLARRVEVSVVFKCVVGAEENLYGLSDSLATPSRCVHTNSLDPGSFTAVYCSSLYFLNAGSRDCISFGVNALISVPPSQQ